MCGAFPRTSPADGRGALLHGRPRSLSPAWNSALPAACGRAASEKGRGGGGQRAGGRVCAADPDGRPTRNQGGVSFLLRSHRRSRPRTVESWKSRLPGSFCPRRHFHRHSGHKAAPGTGAGGGARGPPGLATPLPRPERGLRGGSRLCPPTLTRSLRGPRDRAPGKRGGCPVLPAPPPPSPPGQDQAGLWVQPAVNQANRLLTPTAPTALAPCRARD